MKKGSDGESTKTVSVSDIETAFADLSEHLRKAASFQLAENTLKKLREEFDLASARVTALASKESGASHPSGSLADATKAKDGIHVALIAALGTLDLERKRHGDLELKHRASAMAKVEALGAQLGDLAGLFAEKLAEHRKYLLANKLSEYRTEAASPRLRDLASDWLRVFRR